MSATGGAVYPQLFNTPMTHYSDDLIPKRTMFQGRENKISAGFRHEKTTSPSILSESNKTQS